MATLRGRSLAYQPVLVEPREAHLAQLAAFGERTEGRAAIDALVLVDFGASVTLAVVDAHVDVGAARCGPDARAEVGGSRNQPQAFREQRPEHTVAVEGLLEGEPGHLVKAEHDRNAVTRLDVQRGVFEAQRQIPVEAGVGGRPHIGREPDLHAVRESCLDVEVAARDVERVVSVRFVQFGGVLQERDDAEGHGGERRGGRCGPFPGGLGQRRTGQAQHRRLTSDRIDSCSSPSTPNAIPNSQGLEVGSWWS